VPTSFLCNFGPMWYQPMIFSFAFTLTLTFWKYGSTNFPQIQYTFYQLWSNFRQIFIWISLKIYRILQNLVNFVNFVQLEKWAQNLMKFTKLSRYYEGLQFFTHLTKF
jgi:hypothetical protein